MQTLSESETVDSQYRLASVELCRSVESGLLTGLQTTVTRVDIDDPDNLLSQHKLTQFGSTESSCETFTIDFS